MSERKHVIHNSSPHVTPLTNTNLKLRDARVLLRHVRSMLHEVDTCHEAIRTHTGEAWTERDALLKDYHDTLRAVLQLVDDCEQEDEESPKLRAVCDGLRKILVRQRVELIPVERSVPFDAELHECDGMIETKEYPAGVVTKVIEPGYVVSHRDARERVVFRPAKVQVSSSSGLPEQETS